MKLKTKIILAVGFFFALLMLIAGAALYLQHQVKQSTALVLKDNYESLQYSHSMLAQLNEASDTSVVIFERQLRLQEQNITEPGEQIATHQLRSRFDNWQLQRSDSLTGLLRQSIQHIIRLNMDAIERKNRIALNQAKNTTDGITLLCAVVFLIGLSFLFSFPALLLHPISRLEEGMQEIRRKNYRHRVPADGTDELAQLGRSFNEMASRLDEYEHSNLAQIRFEKERAEAVVNSLKDASLGVDQSGRILFANEQALELLHLPYQQVVGNQLSKLCKQNDLLASMVNDEQSVPLKIVVAGREEYFVREQTAIEKDGEPLGIVYSLHNITNFQQRDTAKTNLIATISHELKTPVASIKMGINVLANTPGAVAEEEKPVLAGMQEDANRLLRIISELLNMAQVETGKMTLQITAVASSRIIDQSLAMVAPQAQALGQLIQVSVANPPPVVLADADKASWALANLLGNALRHAQSAAPIQLKVSTQHEWIDFVVIDEGIGIAAAQVPLLFKKYSPLPRTAPSGSGLGLSIVKEIVEAQHGEVYYKPNQPQGAMFGFRLPAATQPVQG